MPAIPLTAEQVRHYREHGYVVVPRVFNADDLAAADATIREITDKAIASGRHEAVLELERQRVDGKAIPRRIYNPFEQHENFRRMATDPRILDRIESLIGGDIWLQHSKLNMKAARVGAVVEWHQDLTYFPHTNDDLVTTLVYLDDASVENGCLQVLPGRHREYFSHARADGTFAGMITQDLSREKPQPLEAPAGSAIFMHCLTPHSSLPNLSDRGRRTLIFEYRASDSFPIYCGESVVKAEALTHLIRGNRATHARFGGPPPLIPFIKGQTKSLYELQELTKAAEAVPTLKS